jgi:hypothetical protein
MEDKAVKKPNLQGRRRRKAVLNILNTKLLKRFIAKYPEYKDLDFYAFEEIIYAFNKVLWEEVIDNIEGVELPEGLGEVYIVSIKGSASRLDMVKSVSIGKAVYHRNIHTEGHFCSIYYTNREHRFNFANREVVRFRAHRDFKRTASKVYREEWMKYRFLSKKTEDGKAYKTVERNLKGKAYSEANLPDEHYNEFDLD